MNAIVQFKKDLSAIGDRGELALPSNVPLEAFNNAAIVAVQDNPDLLNANKASLFKSIRRAAASGLVPDGREGALVVFKSKDRASGQYVQQVQWMPMVFGLIKMVRRSGTVTDIRAHIVYQKELDQERFEYVVGDDEKLTHHPILFGDRGDPIAAYAIAKLKDGSLVREFMSADEIDTVRRAGASQKIYAKDKAPVVSDKPLGIWKDWASEMWKKTVIRRLCKRLDMSTEDVRHVVEEPEFDGMRDVTPRQSRIASTATAAIENQPTREPDQEPTPTEPDQSGTTVNTPPGDAADTSPAVDGGADPIEGETVEIDPESEAYKLGVDAGQEGMFSIDDSPLKQHPAEDAQWRAGYLTGQEQRQSAQLSA